MEPTIVAALVTTAGGLIEKVVGWAATRDPKATEDAESLIESTYGLLRTNLTDGCVRTLLLLEGGQNRPPFDIRASLYPELDLSPNDMHLFDSEFRYRLEYLRTFGVLTLVGGSEYGITHLGRAFLAQARDARDYYGVLFG